MDKCGYICLRKGPYKMLNGRFIDKWFSSLKIVKGRRKLYYHTILFLSLLMTGRRTSSIVCDNIDLGCVEPTSFLQDPIVCDNIDLGCVEPTTLPRHPR